MIEALTCRTGGVRDNDEDVGAEAAERHSRVEAQRSIIHGAPSARAAIERLFDAGWRGRNADMGKAFADAGVEVTRGAIDTAFHRMKVAGTIEKLPDGMYASVETKEDNATRP